jgi:hypothetical protein
MLRSAFWRVVAFGIVGSEMREIAIRAQIHIHESRLIEPLSTEGVSSVTVEIAILVG